jgi:hypothetical protein
VLPLKAQCCRTSVMDIDDILASVDRHDTSPESAALDHQLLTRLWVAERAVSELLPWPGPLMERMMERVRKQVSISNGPSKCKKDMSPDPPTDRKNRRPRRLLLRPLHHYSNKHQQPHPQP